MLRSVDTLTKPGTGKEARNCQSLSRVRLFVTPVGCSPPGSSVHGILQARLEWVAMPFSRGSSPPRHQTWGLLHCRQILYQLSQVGPGRKHSAAFPLLSPVLSKSIPTLAKEISQNCDHNHVLLLKPACHPWGQSQWVGSVLRPHLLQSCCPPSVHILPGPRLSLLTPTPSASGPLLFSFCKYPPPAPRLTPVPSLGSFQAPSPTVNILRFVPLTSCDPCPDDAFLLSPH